MDNKNTIKFKFFFTFYDLEKCLAQIIVLACVNMVWKLWIGYVMY